MPRPTNEDLDNILFILSQTKAAIEFGMPANTVNRNLKAVLGRYWQYPMLGYSALGGKLKLTRSMSAVGVTDRGKLIMEHAVPRQVIVNMLLEMKSPTRTKVRNLLKKYWRVVLVTKEEDARLNAKGAGLRYSMPDGWDRRDVWARYKAVGIKLTSAAKRQADYL